MTTIFINSFVLFFITIDTIGNLPFFLSLTEDAKFKKRTEIAIKSSIIAFFILIAFACIGRYLLEAVVAHSRSHRGGEGEELLLHRDLWPSPIVCPHHHRVAQLLILVQGPSERWRRW